MDRGGFFVSHVSDAKKLQPPVRFALGREELPFYLLCRVSSVLHSAADARRLLEGAKASRRNDQDFAWDEECKEDVLVVGFFDNYVLVHDFSAFSFIMACF